MNLISIKDLKKKDIEDIFSLTDKLKDKQNNILKDKNFILLFSKPSTRTRVSFEVAIDQLGGNAIYMDASTSQTSRGETISDTARVLDRFVDGLIIRWFSHDEVAEFGEVAKMPVINALTDMYHPCQGLTDFYTIKKHFGKLNGLKIVYLGDGNNVTHSLMYAANRLGVNMVVSTPEKYKPHPEIVKDTGIEIVIDPKKAVENADVLYTDTWISMGQKHSAQKIKELKKYQINSKLLSLANKDAIVMHCLPAHRGQEITDEVMDGPQSLVFDQAENRLHVQKGILAWLY